MICNYQDINDYCSNRYSYFFNDTIPISGVVAIDTSEFASVLRVDNITGETKTITPYSTNTIPTCNIDDDNSGITEWECYTIYRDISQGFIGDPPLGLLQLKQKDIITTAYNTLLQDGIVITINEKNVLLPSSLQDQISYKSIVSYAQALYDDDPENTMPAITDANSNIYTLSYLDLVNIFKTYFTKLIYYKNTYDTLLLEVDKCNSLSDLQQLNWCTTKPIAGQLKPTIYSTATNQLSVSSCQDIEYKEGCYPPCEYTKCLECNNGTCVSRCAAGQYCCDGECQNTACSYCTGFTLYFKHTNDISYQCSNLSIQIDYPYSTAGYFQLDYFAIEISPNPPFCLNAAESLELQQNLYSDVIYQCPGAYIDCTISTSDLC